MTRLKRGSYAKTRLKELEQFAKKIKEKAGEGVKFLGLYRTELVDVITGIKEIKFYKNVICDDGLTMIMNNLSDPTPDNDMLVSHALLGNDATAVAGTDSVLGNETYRNAIASRSNGVKVGYFTAFFNQTEVSGTFYEAGIVSDGTASADTGVLLSHVNINVVKSSSQKLTIDWTITAVSA